MVEIKYLWIEYVKLQRTDEVLYVIIGVYTMQVKQYLRQENFHEKSLLVLCMRRAIFEQTIMVLVISLGTTGEV